MLNTNGKISPEDGDLIPWTIEYVSYVDTMPNFSTDLRYDANLTSNNKKNISPKQYSISRHKISLNIEDNARKTYVDELFGFSNSSYRINSTEGLSSEVLIRYHTLLDGKEANILGYFDLSAILSGGGEPTPTYGYTGDIDNVTSVYWDANDFKIKAVGVTMSYENGLLKTVSEQKNLGTVNTVGFELSQE